MTPTDYRALLKKYILHIITEESVDYLSYISVSNSPFTDSEYVELRKLSEEVDAERGRLTVNIEYRPSHACAPNRHSNVEGTYVCDICGKVPPTNWYEYWRKVNPDGNL